MFVTDNKYTPLQHIRPSTYKTTHMCPISCTFNQVTKTPNLLTCKPVHISFQMMSATDPTREAYKATQTVRSASSPPNERKVAKTLLGMGVGEFLEPRTLICIQSACEEMFRVQTCLITYPYTSCGPLCPPQCDIARSMIKQLNAGKPMQQYVCH